MSDTESDDEEEEGVSIVIDNGSCMIKAGFAGDDAPRAIFPSIVGRSNHQAYIVPNQKNVYVGDEALSKRGILQLRYPIEHGIITSWDDMEKIWHHVFYDNLRIEPQEHSVLLTESPLTPKVNREKMTQIMFETFNTPSLYINITPIFSLIGQGRTSGVVLDSGLSKTHVVPIVDLQPLNHAIYRSVIGGHSITDYLTTLFIENNIKFNGSATKNNIKEIKEKHCYVALDYDDAFVKNPMLFYKLPDGQIISIGSSLYKSTECLFNVKLIGLEEFGLHEMIYNSVIKCDIDIRQLLFNNILICGGNTLFKGINKRLLYELRRLTIGEIGVNGYIKQYYNKNNKILCNDIMNIMYKMCDCYNINLIKSKINNKYLVWIGGSIFASLPDAREMFVSKDEYDESGPGIVHRKC